MMGRKYTDEEVIKALDICGHFEACADCVLGDLGGIDKCIHTLMLNALDLINRQRAEIESLNEIVFTDRTEAIKMLKAEAIKEFAERLKKRERSNAVCAWCAHADIYGRRAKECDEPYIDKDGKEQKACFAYAKFESYIDNLVKEMTEGKPCTDGADCSTCENCYHDGGYNECATDGWK